MSSTLSRPEPRVLHGYTLTKDVSFRSVCHAIASSAFVTSSLPVIVSLEVHCSLEQQEIMVKIMREAWKGMLVDMPTVTEPVDGKEGKKEEVLPSPENLRGKILIKVKWTPPEVAAEKELGKAGVESEEEEAVASGVGGSPEKKKKPAKILQELSGLGVYTRSYHFRSLSQPGKFLIYMQKR
jgi:hypothetical protein